MPRPALLLLAAAFSLSLPAGFAQLPPSVDEESLPLVLDRIIPMPQAEGRIDHMTVDVVSGRIFAAVYGDDSVDVLDVHRSREIHLLQGALDEPQGVAYLPAADRVIVSNSADGACRVFDARTWQPLGSVKFADDADQLRFDPASGLVYVGYGDGAIGAFNPLTLQHVSTDFQLPAHPESFQLDPADHRIYVNLASIHKVAVLHLDTHTIDLWTLHDAGENFPMALDTRTRRLFIAARRPARFIVLNMDTGEQIASLPGPMDSDDMAFDSERHRIYIPSGEGFLFVYQQIDADHYARIAKIPTPVGARTSAYYGQVGKHNSLYLAVPAQSGRPAEMWVFETRD